MSTGCYWPNGDEVAPNLNYSPCPVNPISGRDQTHVTCCDNNAVCTDQGLCVGTANLYYRGACTDKTWASSACASECVATLANDNFDQGGFVNILPCANGTGDIEWCCDQGSAGCCGSASNMLLGRLYAWPVDHQGVTTNTTLIPTATAAVTSGRSNSSSSSNAGTTSTAATAAASSSTLPATSSSSDGKTVGMAVGLGVGLGLLLIAVMSFFILRERKRRIQLEKQIRNIDQKLEMPATFAPEKRNQLYSASEMPSAGYNSSSQVSEVPGGGPRYEIAG